MFADCECETTDCAICNGDIDDAASPLYRRALEAAISEAHAAIDRLIAARDEAIEKLTHACDAFLLDETYEDLLNGSLRDASFYHPQTLWLLQELHYLRKYVEGDTGSAFDFDLPDRTRLERSHQGVCRVQRGGRHHGLVGSPHIDGQKPSGAGPKNRLTEA